MTGAGARRRSPWRSRWRSGPLRRRSDQLQAWTGLMLSVVMLALVPLTTALVGGSVHGSLQETAQEQARTGHRTTAVLLHDAPQHLEPGSEEARHVRYPAPVRFQAPDGTPRTGTAEVRPGAPAGSTVSVWSDAAGDLTEPPLTAGEIRLRAAGWAAGAGGVVVLAGGVLHTVVGRLLDRHRMHGWERGWAAVAPHWTTLR